MDRNASFLRCSKLNCYSEFNKMVQALGVHSKPDQHSKLKPPSKGTSAEYNFYQTLSIMLQQVLNNPDPTGQKNELKMIYQWFTLNKPLAPQRVKPSARRPKLVLSMKGNVLPNRPQTAPAALCTNYYSRKTPVCPPSTPALTSFASSYMARTVKTPDPLHTRPATQPLPVRKDWLIDEEKGSSYKPSNTCIASDSQKSRILNLSTSGLTTEAILTNASSVAAQMTLDRFIVSMNRASPTSVITPRNSQQETHPLPQGTNQGTDVETHPFPHKQASPLPVDRSKSLTTLETISEVDYELENCNSNKNPSLMDIDIAVNRTVTNCVQGEEPQGNGHTEKVEHANQKDKSDNNREKPEKDSDELVKVPEVTITNRRNSKSKLNRLSAKQQQTTVQSRKACQVQVVTLNLSQPQASDSILQRTRKPRKLVPIVAGFNQQHYRPRTVA